MIHSVIYILTQECKTKQNLPPFLSGEASGPGQSRELPVSPRLAALRLLLRLTQPSCPPLCMSPVPGPAFTLAGALGSEHSSLNALGLGFPP